MLEATSLPAPPRLAGGQAAFSASRTGLRGGGAGGRGPGGAPSCRDRGPGGLKSVQESFNWLTGAHAAG